MKILITGGSGMLGGELNKIFSAKNEILSLYNSSIGNCDDYNLTKLDITNPKLLNSVFLEFNPDLVIHTAAISTSALADKLSLKTVNGINVLATKNIAELCDKYSAKLIYTSTDLVYAGYRGTLLEENSKLVPISLYAETKLMGEIKIQNTFDNYIILRTALMFGIGKEFGRNHFNQIYNKLKSGKKNRLFDDQFRSPFAFSEAAQIIEQLSKLDLKSEIINFGGTEKFSRYQLGEILCKEFNFSSELVIPISMEDVEMPYKVADVSMNITKLTSYGVKQQSVSETIKKMVGEK